MKLIRTLFAAGLCLVGLPEARAEWPDRPIRIVVPYGPGGGVDSFTRPLAQQLQGQLGQPVVVDNRAGAGGTIGVLNAARSPADGYTLLSGGVHQPMAEALYRGEHPGGRDAGARTRPVGRGGSHRR